ncbi:MAG: nitrous oxide reductase accessory protein NosL [Methylophagaceae bacterium]
MLLSQLQLQDPALIRFDDRQLANVFVEQYGGKVYSFDEINQQLLLEIK